jgi:hypothetical protein
MYKAQTLYTIDRYKTETMFDFVGNPYEGPELDKVFFKSQRKLDAFFKLSSLIEDQKKDIKFLFDARNTGTVNLEVETTFKRFSDRG